MLLPIFKIANRPVTSTSRQLVIMQFGVIEGDNYTTSL
jgi:hypothetical protein